MMNYNEDKPDEQFDFEDWDKMKQYAEQYQKEKSKKVILEELADKRSLKKIFKDQSMNAEFQLDRVEQFRSGKCNVLISTSVTEEGFDIPSCNLVVSFNQPSSVKSYIQVKGRARQDNSEFIILIHRPSVKWILRDINVLA